jgi:hypothetical protein
MATVNKNFRIKHGLVVEGSTATVNGQNILTETGSDQYILNLVGGQNLIDSVASGLSVDGNSQLSIDRTVVDGWYDSNGAAAAALSDAQDYADTAEADAVTAANSYTDGRETAITTAYEAYADQAEVDAKAYTDTREGAITTAYEAYADQAEVDAKAYTDTREGAITTAYEAYADQAEVDAKAYADQKVADLVDSAPALLDTLNELAAAIGDNPNYATDLATSVGEKVAKAGDTMTGLLVLSADPSANLGAATKQYVDAAETDAKAYTDTREGAITTAYEAYADQAEVDAKAYTDTREGAITTAYEAYADQAEVDAIATAQAALDDVLDGTTPFTDLNINDVAKQVAARTTSLASVPVTAYQFNKTNFKSGKFLIKIDNGTHNEISEILVTLDSSNNVAITEYAIVGTNGSRGTITADVDGTHCRIRVNPLNDSTITVAGTVFNA